MTSDAELADRIGPGNRDALAELYDRCASLAWAAALQILTDRHLAEDVVHDGFVAVWQKIGRYEPGRGSLRSWLVTIVRHRAIDRIRARRPSIDVADADEQLLLVTGPIQRGRRPSRDFRRASCAQRSTRSPTSSRRRSSWPT